MPHLKRLSMPGGRYESRLAVCPQFLSSWAGAPHLSDASSNAHTTYSPFINRISFPHYPNSRTSKNSYLQTPHPWESGSIPQCAEMCTWARMGMRSGDRCRKKRSKRGMMWWKQWWGLAPGWRGCGSGDWECMEMIGSMRNDWENRILRTYLGWTNGRKGDEGILVDGVWTGHEWTLPFTNPMTALQKNLYNLQVETILIFTKLHVISWPAGPARLPVKQHKSCIWKILVKSHAHVNNPSERHVTKSLESGE